MTIASNSLVQVLLYGCYFFCELIVLVLNLTDFLFLKTILKHMRIGTNLFIVKYMLLSCGRKTLLSLVPVGQSCDAS